MVVIRIFYFDVFNALGAVTGRKAMRRLFSGFFRHRHRLDDRSGRHSTALVALHNAATFALP
jgi:hypothetical protein